jgi:hypothetical protein
MTRHIPLGQPVERLDASLTKFELLGLAWGKQPLMRRRLIVREFVGAVSLV